MESQMHPSEACFALARRFEGLRLTPYADAGGLMTIGWGHRLFSPPFPASITEAQAEEWLATDMEEAALSVARLVSVPLAQHELDALSDFVFNLGASSFQRSSALALLNGGNRILSADHLLLWNEASVRGKMQVLPGLTARREAERQLFLSGV